MLATPTCAFFRSSSVSPMPYNIAWAAVCVISCVRILLYLFGCIPVFDLVLRFIDFRFTAAVYYSDRLDRCQLRLLLCYFIHIYLLYLLAERTFPGSAERNTVQRFPADDLGGGSTEEGRVGLGQFQRRKPGL